MCAAQSLDFCLKSFVDHFLSFFSLGNIVLSDSSSVVMSDSSSVVVSDSSSIVVSDSSSVVVHTNFFYNFSSSFKQGLTVQPRNNVVSCYLILSTTN